MATWLLHMWVPFHSKGWRTSQARIFSLGILLCRQSTQKAPAAAVEQAVFSQFLNPNRFKIQDEAI
jgi:hypothetical protein